MRLSTRVVLVLAVIAALLSASPGGAGAQERTPEELRELSDDDFAIAMYALDYEISEDLAADRLERIERVRPLLKELRKLEADRLAGSGFGHTADTAGWIRLTGSEQPSSESQAILDANQDLVLELGAANTLEELEAAVDDRNLIDGLGDDIEDLIAWTDIEQRTGQIVIALDEAKVASSDFDRQSAELADALEENARQALEHDLVGESPIVSLVRASRSESTAVMEGGQRLKTNANLKCTSSFAVSRNGTKGFLTAGHCRKNGGLITEHWDTRDHATAGSSWHVDVGVNRNLLWGEYGDSTWYSLNSGDTVTDDFWATRFEERDVFSQEDRSDMNGDYVCHFGAESFRSCGTVGSTSHDPSYSICDGGWLIGCSNRWVRVDGTTLNTCGGDSGGPVFHNRKAYGVQSGAQGTSACGDNPDYFTFTAIDDIEDRLDVTLMK